jgi:hypothetical protein
MWHIYTQRPNYIIPCTYKSLIYREKVYSSPALLALALQVTIFISKIFYYIVFISPYFIFTY